MRGPPADSWYAGQVVLPVHPLTWEVGPYLRAYNIALAISHAEGYWAAGSAPRAANNPGSIKHANTLIVYPTNEAGWRALVIQIQRWQYDPTHPIKASMTWENVSRMYVWGTLDKTQHPDPPPWLATVIGYLGVPATSTPEGYMMAAAGT